LQGPEEATAIVLEIIGTYQAKNVELLWEAPGIRTEKDMGILQELLSSAGVGQPSTTRSSTSHSKEKEDEILSSRETKRRKQTAVK